MATVLSNVYASFTFNVDGTTGLKLDTFKRVGGATWTNSETNLWKAKVFDTTAGSPWSASALTPTTATLGAIAVTTDATGSQFTATWTAVPVGGVDALNVSIVYRLNNNEDFLRYRLSAAWNGVATKYSLDSIGITPLLMNALNAGNDYAVMPISYGISSQDPVANLKYMPASSPHSSATFGGMTTNSWQYPTGRGWTMGVWGYYETTSSEGWMLHVEDWSDEAFTVTFQSDSATHLQWEHYQTQPDNVLIGNNGRTLGSQYTYCLRPLLCSQVNGWWDIGAFYRSRIEALKPSWYVVPRKDRPDLTGTERAWHFFIDANIGNSAPRVGDGSLNNLASIIDAARVGSGASLAAPIVGSAEVTVYKIERVGENPVGDAQAAFTDLYLNHNCFFTSWTPGLTGPGLNSIYRWDKTVAGDSAELRWWADTDAQGALHMSRAGRLGGGGADRLLEGTASTFYRERTYPVTAWDPATHTASVTGNPSGDGFTGTTNAVLVPASSSARLAGAVVQTLGASSVRVTSNFIDGAGATVTPVAGFSVIVYQAWDDNSNYCPDASIHSSTFLDRLTLNTSVGSWHDWYSCGRYVDQFTDPQWNQPIDSHVSCYRDHSTWSVIDAGYTRHPYGGGDWWVRARRDYLSALRSAGRDAQAASSFSPFWMMSSEDADETTQGVMDYCWRVIATGANWKGATRTSLNADLYRAIPLYPVVHSGKLMGRALNHEFSTAIGSNSSPANDPALHKTEAYELAAEWPYGMTYPTLSIYQDDTHPMVNLWNDALYVSGGGAISDTVKAIRDLWSQIQRFEQWGLKYLRYGRMMAPGAVDAANTDLTTGYAASTYTAAYISYDVLYAGTAFPRVTHCPWRADDDSIGVVLANWSDTAAKLAVTLDTKTMGIGAPGSGRLASMTVSVLDENGSPTTDFSASLNVTTAKLTITGLSAFSVGAVVITPPVDLGTIPGDPRGDPCSAKGTS